MIVPLQRVIFGEYVRKWCRRPYPNHPKGCPNYGKRATCPPEAPMFDKLGLEPPYYLVIQEFDIEAQEKRMLERHPKWSKRQARCCLYWQRGLMKRIRDEAEIFMVEHPQSVMIECPEGSGVNLYSTCRLHGIKLEKISLDMKIVRKMVMIGQHKKEVDR